MKNKLWTKIKAFIFSNPVLLLLVFTTWLKLIWVDQIMFDDSKGIAVLVFTVITACSVILFYSVTILFKKYRDWVALLLSIVSSLVLWADIVYWRYFGTLIKVETLQIAGQTTGVTDSVVSLLSYWDLLFFVDIIIASIYLVITRRKAKAPTQDFGSRVKTFFLVLIIVLIPVTITFIRDWDIHLRKFIYNNYDMNLIEFRYGAFLAHGINGYRFFLTSLEHLDDAERQSAVNWIGANVVGRDDNEFTGLAENKNIFLIQFESLQDFVIGKKFEGIEITPNLNKLIKESYYLENGLTVIGGGATSDSDLASNTSVYPLQNEAAFVQYSTDDFTSIAKALKNEGYVANAYHAYRRDFWNRGAAFSSLGFDHFFAGEEYDSGEQVVMGLNDESFYRQTLMKLGDNSKPSFNYVISLSSHHPFTIPMNLRTLPGDENNYDFQTYHYYQAVHYADYSLGVFLDGLKEQGLYNDSLIVVYGDHLAKIGDQKSTEVQEMIENFNITEMDKIPFIYKLPNQKEGYALNHETTQLDLMPTILNLARVSTNFPMFGGDALAGTRRDITKEDAIRFSELMIRFNLFEDFALAQ
ncbi:MAG: LTA synthase family protein [Clostridia bacterium]